MLLNQRTGTIVLLQALLVLCSLTVAWGLRFDFSYPQFALLLTAAPVLLCMRLASMSRFGLNHGYWRYSGLADAEEILKSVGVGSAAFFVCIRYVLGIRNFPVSIYFLEALLTAAFLGGVRFLARDVVQRHQSLKKRRRRDDLPGRVLIVGAGGAAEILIRELPRHGYTPVACVDDDPAKHGVRVHGVPVLGSIGQVPEISEKLRIDELMIAMPSVSGSRMRRIAETCQNSHRKVKIIPGMHNLLQGNFDVGQLREIRLEDLLGRDPVELDLASVRKHLEGKVVMVTGAAGSIGSELCRQILGYHPARLVCVDQSETPLFYLEQSFAADCPNANVAFCVADVHDAVSMRTVLAQHRVRIVFHAAAYKHVPMMEANLREAVKNNVFALLSLLELAQQTGCESFVLISSDKAVHPTSFMGCTKRLGELIVAARPAGSMRCVSVRFGNVLGSQGSVVPLFQEQIRVQRRITITHPKITRYFMTIPEAVSLVMQAYTVGAHGDVLVLDMGEPIPIVQLAKTLIRLSGKTEQEVQIAFTGLRPGEKLYEELFYANEIPLPTSSRKVKCASAKRMGWQTLCAHLQALAGLCAQGSEASIRKKMKEIIPEYQLPELMEGMEERHTQRSDIPFLVRTADSIAEIVATASQSLPGTRTLGPDR